MKKISLGLILIAGMLLSLNADVSMIAPETPEHPIVKPPIDPERPIRPKPIFRPVLYGNHHHTYLTTTNSNCDQYIQIIKEKDAKIEALIQENTRLKEEAQAGLQQRLKEDYDREMQKFEERRK